VATGLAHTLGPAAGDLFAIALLNAAIIGAAAVTLASSYAFGDGVRRAGRHGRGDGGRALDDAAARAARATRVVPHPHDRDVHLRGYLLVAVLMLIVKAVEVGISH
jgi:hypothetical protein